MDITFVPTLGHIEPAISHPQVRRLHYNRYEKLAAKYKLGERVQALDNHASYPPPLSLPYEHETLDQIRHEISAHPKRRCGKIKMEQAAFSRQIQKAHRSYGD